MYIDIPIVNMMLAKSNWIKWYLGCIWYRLISPREVKNNEGCGCQIICDWSIEKADTRKRIRKIFAIPFDDFDLKYRKNRIPLHIFIKTKKYTINISDLKKNNKIANK